jgi:hypothetical protein
MSVNSGFLILKLMLTPKSQDQMIETLTKPHHSLSFMLHIKLRVLDIYLSSLNFMKSITATQVCWKLVI